MSAEQKILLDNRDFINCLEVNSITDQLAN